MSLNVPSGIVTVQSGTTAHQTVFSNAMPVAVFGASGSSAIGWSTGLDGKISFNVFIVSGSVVGAGGSTISQISGAVQVSGAIQVSGTLYVITSGTAIAVGSGSILPVTVLSGSAAALSGLNVITAVTTTIPAFQSGTLVGLSGGNLGLSGLSVSLAGTSVSGGVTVSGSVQVSGTVAVSNTGFQTSGTVGVSGIIQNLQSGTIGLYEWPTYALVSYWSGAVGKGIIGVYNAGGAAGQSGQELELIRLELGIISSGLYNRFDLILGSGNISGTAGTVVAHRFADTASAASGWVDGATQVSGNVISTLHSVITESNASGVMHNYNREWTFDKGPRVQSGQELWVKMTSGIGIGTARFEWVERYP